MGDFLFKYRGELAVPFLAATIALGQPVFGTFAAGFAVSAAGELVRIAALRHIGPKSRRTGRTGSHGVVRTGPYGWTRNPLYLGNLIMVSGVLIALNRPLLLAIGIPLVAIYYRVIIGAEERALGEGFGEEYRRYCAEVSRLFPLPPKAAAAGAAPYPFREIMLPEMNTIVTFEIAFALTGAVGIWRHHA